MTGSLQIKSGTYYAVLNFKDKEGKRKQKWISTELETRGNKRKAEQMLNDLKTQYDESDYIAPNKILFCDFLKEWIDLNKPNVQVTTYDGYIHMMRKHIYPYFQKSGILLAKMRPMDIQKYYAVKSAEGLSPNTVIKHHAVIRSALQYAVKSHLLRENVADLVDKPKREKYQASFYNKDELMQLFKTVQGSLIEVPVMIASCYGLRRSEILGLRWSSIDFDHRLLTVCNKVVRGKDSSGKLVSMAQTKLKSETSNRTLPLCDAMIRYLMRVRENIANNQKIMGTAYNHKYDAYICVNPLGNLIQPDYITNAFPKLLQKNGLRRIRFHDLRHSCATLLLSLGYSMKDIQEWLGHSDFMITANTYTHSDYKNKVKMINSVQELFSVFDEFH
ncbi:MAG: site-specific integrase [Oscillospiraceae bacterium]